MPNRRSSHVYLYSSPYIIMCALIYYHVHICSHSYVSIHLYISPVCPLLWCTHVYTCMLHTIEVVWVCVYLFSCTCSCCWRYKNACSFLLLWICICLDAMRSAVTLVPSQMLTHSNLCVLPNVVYVCHAQVVVGKDLSYILTSPLRWYKALTVTLGLQV